MKWPRLTFDSVVADTRNGLYKHADFYGRGARILKMFNLRDGGLDLERVDQVELDPAEADAFALEPGDILMNRVNSPELVGKCAVIPDGFGPAVFESKNIRIRVRRDLGEPRFFAHYFSSPAGRPLLTQGVKHAIGMATLNNTDLRSTIVPVPPLSEQRRIVELLEQADALRRQRAEADALAARILPSLFRKMFGDPESNPQSWPTEPFEHTCKDVTAGQPRTQRKDYLAKGAHPIVDQGQQFIAGYTDNSSSLYSGDLPVVAFGDHTRAFKFVDFPFCIGADGLRLFHHSPSFQPRFHFWQLNLITIPNAGYARHYKYLREKHLIHPPDDLQSAFERSAEHFTNLAAKRKTAAGSIETLFQTMLHRAFTGDLTAKWREAHIKELLQEMEQQAKAMGLSSMAAHV